jgi:peptidoglycan/xylan/chitin deacetylase (PgdA/CDA1 family)
VSKTVKAANHGTLAILGFHKIGRARGGWNTWFYIPERIFAEQLRYLHDTAWQVIDIATFLRGLDAYAALPPRSALLTFDDGCRQFMDAALPLLQRFKYPSLQFVPTGHIGKTNSFDAGVEPEEPIFDWAELRELERQGVSIQSHGVTHRRFSDLTRLQQDEELSRSKAMLESGLGKRVDLFAFPQGDDGDDRMATEKSLRAAGYRAAFLYGGGSVRLPTHAPYQLARVAMGPDTNLEFELGNSHAE